MFTTAASVGVMVGFAFAAVDFFILLPLIERPLKAAIAAAPPGDRERPVRRLGIVRAAFLLQFIVFPIVGFVVGRLMDAGSAA